MKQKHLFVLLLAIAFTALLANTSNAHPHRYFNNCYHEHYGNYNGGYYDYRYMPPPPPPMMYYSYHAPRYFYHRPFYHGCGGRRRW
ncbi:MAG: hypothetical protein RJA07_1703 [Bacteroidota bacterium]|jgi:hypothetical protein